MLVPRDVVKFARLILGMAFFGMGKSKHFGS
jgi:hypothetical protein